MPVFVRSPGQVISPISVAHGLIRALTLALFLGLSEVGSEPPGGDGCAHLHHGAWRLSPQARPPVYRWGWSVCAAPDGGGVPSFWGPGSHLRTTVTLQRGGLIGAALSTGPSFPARTPTGPHDNCVPGIRHITALVVAHPRSWRDRGD